jgi:hypothetical protein
MTATTPSLQTRRSRSPRWARRSSLLLLILQPVLFFWDVVVTPRAHIPYDIEGFHLPLIAYVARSFRNGVAPLWDPYSYGGMPIHADSQAQVFYPFTWLAILASNHSHGETLFYWIQVLVPLHMVLAGLFVFWLLRRMGLDLPAAFLGGTIYQLSAYFASQAQHLDVISCGAWLPLAILAVFEMRRRVRPRWIAVLGLAIAMSILSGLPQTAVVVAVATLLMLAALLATRGASWRLIPATAAGFVLGALISTVELVPLWHLTQVSIASLRSSWMQNGGGLVPQSLVSFLIPDYYHIFEPDTSYKLPYNFTLMYVYCGMATPLLLLLAPFVGRARGRALLILTAASVFWMLGGHTPVYESIFIHLPGLVRGGLYAEYALMAFCFFAALTAAVALDRLGKRLPQALLWAIALATSFDLIHTSAGRPMNTAETGYKQEDPLHQIAGSRELLSRLRELVNQTTPPSRIDYMDQTLRRGVLGADMLELPTDDGDNPFMLRRMLYLRRLFCGGNWWERDLLVNRPGSPLLSMLNVGWLVRGSPLPESEVQAAGLESKGSFQGVWLYRNPRALPRFFLVSQIRRSPGETATFQMLAQAGFHPAGEALVENIPGDRSGLATGPVTVQSYTANRIQLSTETAGAAFLATSEPMYPGWEATVNGKRQPLLMTNGAFRGLLLGAGPHEITLEYHPPYLGLYLFLSSVLGLLTLAVAVPGERLWRKHAVVAQEESVDSVETAPVPRGRPRWVTNSLAAIRQHRLTIRWMLLFVPAMVLFYWKILLTRQFSLLTERESVNQSYAWLRFWVSSVRHGVPPFWDPYAFAGHSFAGEMQTAAFYPLHLLLALFPLTQDRVLSPYLYQVWWAGAHLLGACLLFLLVREFGLSRFSAFVAGLCFPLGGFVSRANWPHMLESGIWLPLIFFFFLRAIRAGEFRPLLRYASLGGLALGLSILAGGFHIVIMQALVVLSAGVYYAVSGSQAESAAQRRMKAATAVIVIAGVGCAAGAVQLFPSMEYARQAIRFLGNFGSLPADQKIPYQYVNDALAPHGILMLLFPTAFDGNVGNGEVINPYLGVFPLLLAIIAIRKNWVHPWVRYLTGLALAALVYSFGPFSWLHGVLYAIVPKLWMAREAPRMLYLLDFSLAVLAAFGLDTLLARGKEATWTGLNRTLLAMVIACALFLFVPALLGKPQISPWVSLSIFLIFASYGLFHYILRGHSGGFVRVLIVGLVLFDLNAFEWNARNLIEVRGQGADYLDRALSMESVVDYLKALPGYFRVEVQADGEPNIGDLFGASSIRGGGVTYQTQYNRILDNRDLLNVRYLIKPASAADPRPIYQDAFWKVYENPSGSQRAWLVHETMPDSGDGPLPAFDFHRTALLSAPIPDTLAPAAHAGPETAEIAEYSANAMTVKVHAETPGLLVLSETFYPGWRATVNGTGARIYRVDVDLRGVVVPAGNSEVVLEYRPWSIYGGALLSLLAFFGAAFFCFRTAR